MGPSNSIINRVRPLIRWLDRHPAVTPSGFTFLLSAFLNLLSSLFSPLSFFLLLLASFFFVQHSPVFVLGIYPFSLSFSPWDWSASVDHPRVYREQTPPPKHVPILPKITFHVFNVAEQWARKKPQALTFHGRRTGKSTKTPWERRVIKISSRPPRQTSVKPL